MKTPSASSDPENAQTAGAIPGLNEGTAALPAEAPEREGNHDEKPSLADGKRIAPALDLLERVLSAILETLPLSVWYVNHKGEVQVANSADEALWTGLQKPASDQLARYKIWRAGLQRQILQEKWAVTRAVLEGIPILHEPHEIVCWDGTRKSIVHSAVPMLGPNREIQGAIAVNEDTTERKRTEKLLRQSEAELRVTFENAPIGMVLKNTHGHPLKCNRALQQFLGYSEEELRGMTLAQFSHPDDAPRAAALFQEVIAGRREHFQIEKRYLRKDKEVIWGRLTGSAVRGPSHEPQYVIAMIEDITEKKKLESQLMRAQRLESIGTLAGGIAHDLNNVLAPILLSCELLQGEKPDPDTRENVAMIKASAQRGAELVRQVLSFARGIESGRASVQPAHSILEIANLARETFPKSIHIQTRTPQDLRTVCCDSTQLHQVLLNLCVNARDAMPAGGDLTVIAENVWVDADQAAKIPAAKPGPYVVITISDTGIGIPPDMQKKIFEPFFTTKEAGKGTGLGLSTTLDIVKSRGGFVNLSSAPGKGTAFAVWLPAQTGEKPAVSRAEETRLLRGQGELILVVDDEAALRAVTKEVLRAYGYTVLTAANGFDAVALYSQHKDEIKVVVTDMMMPGMDGDALIRALTEVNPAARIIALSGHPGAEYETKGLEAGAKTFLPKPYTVETLLTALAEILRNI